MTLEQAQARLALYEAAEAKVLAGQSYSHDGVTWTRANLAAIQQGIAIYERKVAALSRCGIRVRGVVPE